MESPTTKRALKPKIRTPFSPKSSSPQRLSPLRASIRKNSPSMPVYIPQPRMFNSRKKMAAEIASLTERVAAAEKAKALLVQQNTMLHLEYRTLTEELANGCSKSAKHNEKLAEKTKNLKTESLRMKAQIAQLHVDLAEAAETQWRTRLGDI